MSAQCDCAVVGGGPAGAVAALVLARAGRAVLLCHEPPSRGPTLGESLPGAARPLLRDFGLLEVLHTGPHLVSHGNVAVWGSRQPVAVDGIDDPHGVGWHLQRPRFDADLRMAAVAAGAVLWSGRVEVSADAAGWSLRLGGRVERAAWLLDASGRRALAARLGLARRLRDESLVAVCTTTVASGGVGDSRTWVEAVPDGWWSCSRLADGRQAVALQVDADLAAAVLHTPGAWQARLDETVHLRGLLRDAVFPSAPRGVEACGGRLAVPVGSRWVAAGDAALSFDPLSAQGVFFALYSGIRAAQAVCGALRGDDDAPGAYAARLESIRAAYLRQQRHFYGLERRWPEHAFWRRRQGA